MTTYPLGKKRCGELGLRNVRICVAPQPGRAMIVGDFSRRTCASSPRSRRTKHCSTTSGPVATHIRLARDFYIAYKPDAPLSQKSFAEWCDAYQAGKTHPDFDAIKEPRVPAKNGNYSF